MHDGLFHSCMCPFQPLWALGHQRSLEPSEDVPRIVPILIQTDLKIHFVWEAVPYKLFTTTREKHKKQMLKVLNRKANRNIIVM